MTAESNREIIGRRKNRLLASILSYKDEYLNQYLPEDVAACFRDVLMDEINDYHHYVSSFVEDDVHVEPNLVTVSVDEISPKYVELVERIDAIFTMVKDIHED